MNINQEGQQTSVSIDEYHKIKTEFQNLRQENKILTKSIKVWKDLIDEYLRKYINLDTEVSRAINILSDCTLGKKNKSIKEALNILSKAMVRKK